MAKNPDKFETAFETYTVTGVVGEGGAGRVFEVKDSNGRLFAVKCLRPELASGEKRKRFKNEIEFCSKNDHPNLIKVLGSGTVLWDGNPTVFYVMPRYAGTLRGLMEKRIAPGEVLRIFGQILDGVEAAHRLGVTHRDLKPENILYDTERGLCVVADFGIAHFEAELIVTVVETKKHDKLLNVAYSAPEQRLRSGKVDQRADIFALGQMLNEMYTGVVPEGAGHLTIATAAPDFGYLDNLVERMRQQDPGARPQAIEEIKKELIARKNEFIAFQELDEKKRRVVHAGTPPQVQELNITDARWERDVLTIQLNRAPEPPLVRQLQEKIGAGGYMSNLHPHMYNFRGDAVLIQVEERYAQTAIDQFKRAIAPALSAYQDDLARVAQAAERAMRNRLAREVEEAEARARVTKALKF